MYRHKAVVEPTGGSRPLMCCALCVQDSACAITFSLPRAFNSVRRHGSVAKEAQRNQASRQASRLRGQHQNGGVYVLGDSPAPQPLTARMAVVSPAFSLQLELDSGARTPTHAHALRDKEVTESRCFTRSRRKQNLGPKCRNEHCAVDDGGPCAGRRAAQHDCAVRLADGTLTCCKPFLMLPVP